MCLAKSPGAALERLQQHDSGRGALAGSEYDAYASREADLGGASCATPSSSRGAPADCRPSEQQLYAMLSLDKYFFGRHEDARRHPSTQTLNIPLLAARQPALLTLPAPEVVALIARVRAVLGAGAPLSSLLESHANALVDGASDVVAALRRIEAAHPGAIGGHAQRARLRSYEPAAAVRRRGPMSAEEAVAIAQSNDARQKNGEANARTRAPRRERELAYRERFPVGGTYKGVADRDADLVVRFWNLWGGSNRCRGIMSASSKRSVYRSPQDLERIVVNVDRALPYVDAPMLLTNEPELLQLTPTEIVRAYVRVGLQGGRERDVVARVADDPTVLLGAVQSEAATA